MHSITDLHKQLLLELERIKKDEKIDLSYTLRKDNFGRMLQEGYWFPGDESKIYLSFWTGHNWITKNPNIALLFDFVKGLIYLEITVEKESKSKLEFVQDVLVPNLPSFDGFDQFEEYEELDFLIFRHRLGPIQLMKELIFKFIFSTKKKIDDLISENVNRYFLNNYDSNFIGFIDKASFKKSLIKVKNYFDYVELNQEFEIALGQNKDRPFYLSSFEIGGFGPIQKMELNNIPVGNRWIFVTGANGSGKSMLLRALASFLGNGIITRNYFSQGESRFLISLLGQSGFTQVYQRNGNDDRVKNSKRSMLRGFAAYGVNRTAIRTFESKNRKYSELSKNGFLDSIMQDHIVSLIDYNETVEEWNSSEEGENKFNHRREFFVKALLRIVPGLVDIHFRMGKKRMISEYFIRYGDGRVEKMFYNQLSSGTRSILSFVADIIVRFYHQQPEAYDPSQFKGVVIVDEIDLHLHPQGQKDLVLALSEIFPNIQFIVSTHSPIPLLAAPDNSVFLTIKQGEKGAELIGWNDKIPVKKLLPNALYTSPVFGMEAFLPFSDFKKEEYYVEDDFSDIQLFDRVSTRIEQLSKLLNKND